MKITVVIPLYNKKDSITSTLKSVFEQTFLPEEIIVVNDGSTDDSEKLVEALKHPLVKILNQPNKGVSSARNIGIKEAAGDWIAFLDADDIWLPDFLEKMRLLFNTFPESKMFASSYFLQNQTGLRINIQLNRLTFTGKYGKLENYFEVASVSHPPICSSAVIIERNALNIIGGFPQNVKSGEDLITWAKLASNIQIAYTKEPLSVFLYDESNYNGTPTRIPQEPDAVGSELIALATKYNKLPGIRNYVSLWFKMRSSVYLRLGMKKEALSEAIKSLAFNPFNFKVLVYILLLPVPLSLIIKIFRKLGNA